jgi:hypothetical protein
MKRQDSSTIMLFLSAHLFAQGFGKMEINKKKKIPNEMKNTNKC